jgi:hypothetical protein
MLGTRGRLCREVPMSALAPRAAGRRDLGDAAGGPIAERL